MGRELVRFAPSTLATVGFIALAALLGTGCSAASTPEVANGDPVLEQGRDIYIRQCASCHGAAGGGGRGTKINEGAVLAAFPEVADHVAVVRDGRGGMPAFSGRLTDDELDAVVRYSREILAVAGEGQAGVDQEG